MKKNTRRDFLRLISIAPAGSLLFNMGCVNTPTKTSKDGRDVYSADVQNRQDMYSNDVSRDLLDKEEQDFLDADLGEKEDLFSPDSSVDRSDSNLEFCEPTGSDVEGPFHVDNAPHRRSLVSDKEEGTKLIIRGRVVDENCRGISGASLDIWQADHSGQYHEKTDSNGEEYRLRGQLKTDKEGFYQFDSIKPGRYPLGGSLRPSHIHFIVSKPGFEPLTTQLYFKGDPYLKPNDPCGNGCNSGDASLIIDLKKNDSGIESGFFEITLTK